MNTPRVTVIISAYLEASKAYLDLCVKSVMNLNYPKNKIEVLIVSPKNYQPTYPNVRTIHPEKAEYYPGHALNFGAQQADPKSDYFLFTNDDTILTKNCLTGLIESSREISDRGIIMPLSNDTSGKHLWPVPFIRSGPYRLDQIKGHEEALMNTQSPYKFGMMFFEKLCLYSVLVPRTVYEAVGPYYEDGWGDDIDYCLRTAKKGFLNVITMTALVYHSMGASADKTLGALDSDARKEEQKKYEARWEKIDGAT